MDTVVTVRCRPFSGQAVQDTKILVSDKQCYVWDPVSHHWTLRHSLSRQAIRKALKEARLAWEDFHAST